MKCGTLCYRKTREDSEDLGVIELTKQTSCRGAVIEDTFIEFDKANHFFYFLLSNPTIGRTYVLRAASREERDNWVNKLQFFIDGIPEKIT